MENSNAARVESHFKRRHKMIHVFKTADEPEKALVMHRNFDGEHEFSESCWLERIQA